MRIAHQTKIWEYTPMLRLLLPLVLGIIIYDFAAQKWIINIVANSSALWLSFVFAFSILLLLLVFLPRRFFGSIATIIFIILGFATSAINDNRLQKNAFRYTTKDESATLTVVSENPIIKSKTIKIPLTIVATLTKKQIYPTNTQAYLYLYRSPEMPIVQLGDTLLVPNRWQPICNAGNPYEMDYEQFCARKNIFFQQFLAANEFQVFAHCQEKPWLQKIHEFSIQTIEKNIKDSSSKALLKAMLLGDEQDIDPNTRKAYSDTGIIHIVSISGAHVAILFGFIVLCFGLLPLRKHHWLKYIFGLALVWFYVLLAGASTPALRAAIVFTIVAVGAVLHRQSNPLNYLFSAAFLMLLWQPMWLFTIGFQLSFVAVLSLFIFFTPIRNWLPEKEKIEAVVPVKMLAWLLNFIADAITLSIAAELLVAPLVAYYFHSFPPMFIIANVVASLSMSIILILGMVLLLLGNISILGSIISYIIVLLSTIFHTTIHYLQGFSFDAFQRIFLSPMAVVSLYGIVISTAILFLKKQPKAVWATLSFALLFSLLQLRQSVIISNQEKIIVYNNGQADWIKGNKYQTIVGSEEETFSSKNAHIGFGVSKSKKQDRSDFHIIEGKKILIIDSISTINSNFPIDILIVSNANKFSDPGKCCNFLQMKKIILGKNISNYQKEKWRKAAIAFNIELHDTKTEGAFVFPTFEKKASSFF